MRPSSCIDYILSSDPRKRNKALEFLYKNSYPKIETYVLLNSGTVPEAKDLFQDTIAVVYKNLLKGTFRGDSALTSYIYSVSKNLWLQQIRKRKIATTVLKNEELTDTKEEELNVGLIDKILRQLDADCRSLLISFYFHEKNMQEVATQFALSSTQVAKTKKLRCMKKLSEIVRGYGLEKDHFII